MLRRGTANGSSGAIGGGPRCACTSSRSATTTGCSRSTTSTWWCRDGEFFGLLGPNGAGKTTLISAVCNLIRATSGSARVFGHPHDSLEARRLVGLAEQDVNLDRFLDVEETLLYHGGYYGMSARARRAAAPAR